MPIRADLRHHYRTKAWAEASARTLAADQYKCRLCQKPHLERVQTVTWGLKGRRKMLWRGAGTAWIDEGGWRATKERLAEALSSRERVRMIRVVLQTAHLNNVAGDDRDENLASLCGWCHLMHDRAFHKETRATRKDLARPIQWPMAAREANATFGPVEAGIMACSKYSEAASA